ncbi:hypothetical protein Poly30_21830 [Planctomycetes bacterium Poly30]|uniref:Cytochrome c domain-containing protein n=1 Tax=Saltatorellus ferox TaxID=2528018 RepID=A0A518ERE6_9BACT|nr:hypothetical protein Poly30_21830 [Planctomycetes bacterium Poly30]
MMPPFARLLPAALCLFVGTAAAQQQPQPLMGLPVPGLTPAESTLFLQGLAAFSAPLLESEGAGPVFNETTCAGCHNVPAIGGFGTRRVTRFGVAATATTPFQALDQFGGTLLQDQSFSLTCRESLPPQANHTALRGTPILFGSGLIDSIPDSVLIARANQQPSNLAGRVHMAQPIEDPNGPMRVGRFGWKGGIATVDSFSLDAGLNEMGLTSQFLPFENAPNGDPALLALCDTVADPEDAPDAAGFTRTDRFTHFQKFLAAPAQTPRSGMSGELIFEAVGCADCHVPSYTTGQVADPALSGQHIQPYSDFLLHDMGALGDGIVEGEATETEMMTRPLWGLAQRGTYLHDGRAVGQSFEGNVEIAIAEHGGTAQPSAAAYQALSQADKDLMLSFLASLGRAEFDWDTNNTLDEFDWPFLEPLVTGPDPSIPVTPDDPGAIGDLDQDGDFDLVEFGSLQRVWTGQ